MTSVNTREFPTANPYSVRRDMAPRGTSLEEFFITAMQCVEENGSKRLNDALTIFTGQRDRMHANSLQQPLLFVPGLSAKPWHDVSEFAWHERIEAAAEAIGEELLQLRSYGKGGFQPYMGEHEQQVCHGKWNKFYLEQFGMPWRQNRWRCPQTVALMETIPRRTGSVCFSALTAGTHIQPHCGGTNAKLRCHLALVGSDKCEIRVGNDIRQWRDGTCLMFDDSYEHEVRHRGEQARIVLSFDVWHPDLTDSEVQLLSDLIFASPLHERSRNIQREQANAPQDTSWWR